MRCVIQALRSMLSKYCFLVVFYILPQVVDGQGKISGKVINAISREPLAGATVYIDQTKLITQSDANGYFVLEGVQLHATLIFSYTGYKKITFSVEGFGNNYTVEMTPDSRSMDNIVLHARIKDTWQKWGKLFLDILLGKDMNTQCILQNPEDVRFRYDNNNMVLTAWARKQLVVENKMLGYNLHIDFDSLAYSLVDRTLLYSMTEYFKTLDVSDETSQKIVAANRLRAYRGSRMHFARSLYSGKTLDEGFRMYQYKGVLNEERVRVEKVLLQSLADQNESGIKENLGKADLTSFQKDTSRYYRKILDQPGYFFEDSLPYSPNSRITRKEERESVFKLGADSLLLVYNEPENSPLPGSMLKKWARIREPGSSIKGYDFIQAGSGTGKYSLLYLLRGETLSIKDNGFIENNTNLFFEGYLADNRLAYDLPWDYDPVQDEQKLLNEQFSLMEGPGRTLENNLSQIASAHTGSSLYLHLDKTIYDVGENIWFSAYLLHAAGPKEAHHTLYVMLQDPLTKKKIAAEKFILNDGKSAGYIFLADSFPAGTYHLLAYTNKFPEEKSPLVFEQAVEIRPAMREYTLQMSDTGNIYRNDSVFINCSLKNETGWPVLSAATVEISEDGKLIASGRVRVKDNGQLSIKGIPLKKFTGRHPVMKLTFEQSGRNWELRKELTVWQNFLRIRWYPEGGELVAGLPSRLSYEIMDMNYQPVRERVKLMEGNRLVGILNEDGSGAGTVGILPQPAEQYTVELFSDSLRVGENEFPEILKNGYTLAAESGLIEDSMRIIVRATVQGAKLYVMAHNYQKHFYFDRIALPGTEKRISLPASMLPTGLSTVTLFDEKGRPVAERSFFREPRLQPLLTIEIDSSVYHQRSKLKATIRTADKDGNPVAAVFSMACVLNSRIDTTRFQDIVPFSYFNQYRTTGVIEQKTDYNQYQRSRMERYLQIQGWTRYKWQLLSNSPVIASPAYTLVQRGYVFYYGEKLKKPVEVALVTPASLTMIQTDSSGYFEINKDQLATEPDWKISLAVNEKKQDNYAIAFLNDNDELQYELAAYDYPLPRQVKYIPDEPGPTISDIKMLAPVTLTSKNGNDDDAARIIRGFKKDPVICSDYVCMYNIVNCINHAGGTRPQKGFYYKIRIAGSLKDFRYTGCLEGEDPKFMSNPYPDSIIFQLKGRYYSKEFYMADYNKYNPPLPETQTTLYWNPFLQTDEKGEVVISFYTNDLKGRHILIAEGITAEAVLSGRRQFRVIQ